MLVPLVLQAVCIHSFVLLCFSTRPHSSLA